MPSTCPVQYTFSPKAQQLLFNSDLNTPNLHYTIPYLIDKKNRQQNRSSYLTITSEIATPGLPLC